MEDNNNNIRNRRIIDLRLNSIGTTEGTISTEELFQNRTLRSIIKFQNDLLIAHFRNYAVLQKNTFFGLSPENKMSYIEKVIKVDSNFRNTLKGIVIGLFTLEEYKEYILNSSELNKRISTMIIERLKSQILVIEK